MTDEGLHQAVVEMGLVEDKQTGEYIVWTGVKKASTRDAGKWIVQRFGTREEAVSFMEQLNSHLVTKMANLINYVEVPWWLP